MIAEIIEDADNNNVPYVELKITPSDPGDDDFEITFRKYHKRIFVGVTDDRANQSGGQDLDDCWCAPTIIIERTLRNEFDPYKSFFNALAYIGKYQQIPSIDERDYDGDYWQTEYREFEPVIKEWSQR